jgi:hypothetical protein
MEENNNNTNNNNNKVTFVSAFIANANQRHDRSVADYIEYGKKLMAVPANKIIFFDESLIDLLPQDCFNSNNVIVPVKKEENYLYQHADKLTNFHLNTTYPGKDTMDYMLTICNKTEHVRRAIEMNPFHSTQFIWIDFGINHVFRGNTFDEFSNAIIRMQEKTYENVAIASIWAPSMYHMMCANFNNNIYQDVMWFFAGGVFGGESDALIKFADLTKQKCIQIIEEKQTIMWEVNVWHLIYRMDRWKFLYYISKHDNSILDNY